MAASSRPRLTLRLSSAALLIVGLGMIATWTGRAPVTDVAVRRYLAAKGVDAAAKTVAVGRTGSVFDHVRLGPEAAPDLTARRIVIDLNWSAFRPLVAGVRLDAAKLKMHADAGGVSFGSLDTPDPTRPLDAISCTSGRSPRCGDHATDAGGKINARVDAAGQLDRDFRATGRTTAVALRWANCNATIPDARFTITTAARDFAVAAKGRLVGGACRGATAPAAAWTLAVGAPVALTQLSARASLTAARAIAVGTTLSGLALDAALEGPPAGLHGHWAASLAGLATAPTGPGRPTRGTLKLRPAARCISMRMSQHWMCNPRRSSRCCPRGLGCRPSRPR